MDPFAHEVRGMLTSGTKSITYTDFSVEIDLYEVDAVGRRVLAYGGTVLWAELVDQPGIMQAFTIPPSIEFLAENMRVAKIGTDTDCDEVRIIW